MCARIKSRLGSCQVASGHVTAAAASASLFAVRGADHRRHRRFVLTAGAQMSSSGTSSRPRQPRLAERATQTVSTSTQRQESQPGTQEWLFTAPGVPGGIQSVSLTIHAFNPIRPISASSHADLNVFMLWNLYGRNSKSGVKMDKESFGEAL